MKLLWNGKVYVWKLNVIKKSVWIHKLFNGNVTSREIKFFSFWNRKKWKGESDCVEDWASKFGDRSLTIGKSGLEFLIQSKTQPDQRKARTSVRKKKTNWEWHCSSI